MILLFHVTRSADLNGHELNYAIIDTFSKSDKEPRCERTLPCDRQKGKPKCYYVTPVEITLKPKIQVDIAVSKIPVRQVIETAKRVLYTGHIGVGRILITDVENIVRVRTGEEGHVALQSDWFCVIIFNTLAWLRAVDIFTDRDIMPIKGTGKVGNGMKCRHHSYYAVSRLAICRVAKTMYVNFNAVRFFFAQLFFGFWFTPIPI